ncbi:MAG: UDP-N-acetylmuramoyl-L-alanine--D-glutamate ligase [Alphaproteobacteria bacterium]
MIDLSFLSGLTIAVLGLGKSGMSAASALQAGGADVWAWDDREDQRAVARAAGVPLVDLYGCNWREPGSLVISPGIPHTHPTPHPVAVLAKSHGCEIIGDVELLVRAQRNAHYIGVTGTNGKSTTTALIAHILSAAGREVAVGGNLGIPALDLAPLDAGGIYVLEMSSYQLEITLSITFDVAVLLNVSADHLERHGGMTGYTAAKRLIFRNQCVPQTAVVGVDDEISRGIFADLATAEQIVVPVSSQRACAGGVYAPDGTLIDDSEDSAVRILDLKDAANLPGTHNWQNAAAAYAASKAAGIEPSDIASGLRSFPGLSHRQEMVAVIEGIAYINDSKATNADAAGKALACYETIYWIAGGQPKDGGLASLEPWFRKIAHAYLIGEAETAFAAALDGKVPLTRCGDLSTAVTKARQLAERESRPGAVVLLAPACASFDQFSNFEARGDAFRAIVEALPGARGKAPHHQRQAGGSYLQ